MAAAQGDGTTALVDLHTLRRTATLPARNGPVANALAFFPDGRKLVTGGIAGNVTVWDVKTHSPLRAIRIGQAVWWAAVSPDGRLIAVQSQAQGSSGSQVQVRPITGGPPIWTHEMPDGTGGLYFSPDGRLVAALGCCARGATVAIWHARTGARAVQRSTADHATAISFAPDSRTLGLGTENGQLLFWDARSGKQRAAPMHAATGNIDTISFSPDGSLVAAGAYDRTSTLWDVRSHQQVGDTFPEQVGAAPAVLFEPNGRLLIYYDSNAAQWPGDVRGWERFACRVVGRNLTRAEWHEILPSRPYARVCARARGT